MNTSETLRLGSHIGRHGGLSHTRKPGRCLIQLVIRWAANLIICLCLSSLTAPSTANGQTKKLFRIGTGGLLGVYHPVGKIIAEGLTSPEIPATEDQQAAAGLPGYIGVAQSSGGSVANVRALAAGEIEAGLVQADVASWAYRGEKIFAGDDKVRAIRAVASLYPEKFHIVTRRDAHIRSVSDLRGKRISIDEIGSGTLSVMRIVLDAHGLSEEDMQPVYLKPEFTHERIRSGELQGFVIMAGIPVDAVSRVADVGLSLVPIDRETALRINTRSPYLTPGDIPAGMYPEVPATPTIQVRALLVVSSQLPDDLVYQLTSTLWSPRVLSHLKNGHPQGANISLESALEGVPIPFHPGAEKFYREQGMALSGTQSP